MAKQITNETIRRNIGKLYPFCVPDDQKMYADALVASVRYGEIADQLERKGIIVRQVRQWRHYNSHDFGDISGTPEGNIYVDVQSVSDSENLKRAVSELSDCESSLWMNTFYKGCSKKKDEAEKYSFAILSRKDMPKDGIRRVLQKIKDFRLEDLFVVPARDQSVRIR